MSKLHFENLFVLDLANNHQGSLSHAQSIIDEVSSVIDRQQVRAAFKFQFRQLNNLLLSLNHQSLILL